MYHIDLDERVVRELSMNMECTGDKIVKQINQKTDEILLSIKKQLEDAEPDTAQTSDALGKPFFLSFRDIMIINDFVYKDFLKCYLKEKVVLRI